MRAIIVSLCLLTACGGATTAATQSAANPSASTAAAEPNAAPTPPAAPTRQRIAVRMVLIRFAGAQAAPSTVTRTREQALTRANMVAGLLRDGGSAFNEIGHRYGEGMSTEDESNDGRTISRGESNLEPDVERAAFALNLGEVSDPVLSARGYVLIKRVADPPDGPREISARHILIQHTGSRGHSEEITRTKDEARALAQSILQQLRDGQAWNSLSHYSDEPGAEERHGDLGHFARGAMVPAFEHIAFNLAVDEISDIVETEFGFHIIQRYN